VWTNPALARSLSESGKANAARFSWEKAAREVTVLFDRIIDGAATAEAPAAAAGSRT
jgi:hypothetical protein